MAYLYPFFLILGAKKAAVLFSYKKEHSRFKIAL